MARSRDTSKFEDLEALRMGQPVSQAGRLSWHSARIRDPRPCAALQNLPFQEGLKAQTITETIEMKRV
jgi:hypothetical protein